MTISTSTSTSTSTRRRGRSARLAVLATAAVLVGPLLASGVADAAGRPQAQARAVYTTGFDTDPGWSVLNGNRGGAGSQVTWMGYNVWYTSRDGMSVAEITTRRHCVGPGELPTQANATGKPCSKVPNTSTQYTSGRIQKLVTVPRKKDFEIEFSALMPDNAKKGTRQALWANNNVTRTSRYCAKGGRNDIVEFDNIEWYGKAPTVGRHTTHIGCQKPTKTARREFVRTMIPNAWHTWKVRRVGRTISYFRQDGDGVYQPLGRVTCGAGKFKKTSKKACTRLLNQGRWLLVINGEVFSGKKGPDNTAWFPAQKMRVDWVEVRTL